MMDIYEVSAVFGVTVPKDKNQKRRLSWNGCWKYDAGGEGKKNKIKLNGLLQFVRTKEIKSGTEGAVRQ